MVRAGEFEFVEPPTKLLEQEAGRGDSPD